MFKKVSREDRVSYLVTAGGIAAGAALLVGAALTPATAETATAVDPGEAAQVSSDLVEAQHLSDALPVFLTSGPQALTGIDPSSTRLLGEQDGSRYWVATDFEGQACLIALLPGVDQLAAVSCGDTDAVLDQGLLLQIATSDEAQRLVLLPEGYTAPDADGTLVGDQLVVSDSTTPSEPIEAQSSDGTTLEVPAAPAVDWAQQ